MIPANGWRLAAGHASSRRAREVPAVSLSAHEQQELDVIEGEIAGSDPALAALLATFALLTADEDLPARERIPAHRGPRGRRGPLARGTFLRPGRPAWTWACGLVAVVLWLTVSVALLVSVLVISRGGGGKGCALPGLSCAGQVPAHGVRPGAAGPPAGQMHDTPGHPGVQGR